MTKKAVSLFIIIFIVIAVSIIYTIIGSIQKSKNKRAEETYNIAEYYFENGEYEKAKEEFEKIEEGTEFYTEAQLELEEMPEKIKQREIGEKLKKHTNKLEEMMDTADKYEKYLETYAENNDIVYQPFVFDSARYAVNSFAAYMTEDYYDEELVIGKYEYTFRIIDYLFKYQLGTDNVSKKRTKYEKNLVSYVVDYADVYMELGDYDEAMKAIDHSLEVLPDNQTILDKKAQIQK